MTLGQKLKQLRAVHEYTQEDVEKFVGISRSKIAQVETNRANLSNEELFKLSRFFGQPMEYFFEDEITPVKRSILFRAKEELLSSEDIKYVNFCKEISEMYLDLEDILGQKPAVNYRVYKLPHQKVSHKMLAEALAVKERNFMQLPIDTPISNLQEIIEEQGIFVLEIHLKSQNLDGFFFLLNDERPCIVVNPRNPWSKNFYLAHEYMHVLIDSENIQNRFCRGIEESTEFIEIRANRCAIELLMPKQAINNYFNRKGYKKTKYQVDLIDLFTLMEEFKLSRQVVVNRLANLGWLAHQQETKFRELENLTMLMERSGFKNEFTEFYQRKLRVTKETNASLFIPEKFRRLAITAYKNSLISFGKLAEYLHRPKQELKELEAAITAK